MTNEDKVRMLKERTLRRKLKRIASGSPEVPYKPRMSLNDIVRMKRH